MKQNQTIVKMMMAVAIAFGVQTTASAQFGGLLNKAKKVVTKEQPKKEVAEKSVTREGRPTG